MLLAHTCTEEAFPNQFGLHCMTLSATKQTTTSCLHRSVAHLRDCLPGLSQPGAPKTQIFMNGACSPSLLPALHSPMAFSLPVVPDYR